MSEVDDSKPPRIKVTDRRLFDADGNLREPDASATPKSADAAPDDGGTASADADAYPSAESAAPDGAEMVAEPEPPAGATPAEPAAGAEPDPAATPSAAAEPLQLADEALLKFIEEQYIGGLLALGAMPEPQSGQLMEDLDLAQIRIEVLGLLEERTEGHRSPEAGKALTDVLYQLRMAYLQKRKVVKL